MCENCGTFGWFWIKHCRLKFCYTKAKFFFTHIYIYIYSLHLSINICKHIHHISMQNHWRGGTWFRPSQNAENNASSFGGKILLLIPLSVFSWSLFSRRLQQNDCAFYRRRCYCVWYIFLIGAPPHLLLTFSHTHTTHWHTHTPSHIHTSVLWGGQTPNNNRNNKTISGWWWPSTTTTTVTTSNRKNATTTTTRRRNTSSTFFNHQSHQTGKRATRRLTFVSDVYLSSLGYNTR